MIEKTNGENATEFIACIFEDSALLKAELRSMGIDAAIAKSIKSEAVQSVVRDLLKPGIVHTD